MTRPPWHAPIPPGLSQQLAISPEDVPVVELLTVPLSVAALVALRAGRYVPAYGHGPTRAESRRLVSLLGLAHGRNADPRGAEHVGAMLLHPSLGNEPLRTLARAIDGGAADAWAADLVLGVAGVLGVSDTVRAQVAEGVAGVGAVATEALLAHDVGGGDHHAYREHYQRLRMADVTIPEVDAPARAVTAARLWFDFVLARRWSGIDALRGLSNEEGLDAPSRWLIASAEWIAGDDNARSRMTEIAQQALDPVQRVAPRLVGVVAREMAEFLAHPWAMRWEHLRCAAARDHAAAAIRHWLRAAAEAEFFEDTTTDPMMTPGEYGELGPEPTRAGRTAVESRQQAGEFLLDWFVSEREARVAVDGWAWRALKLYHRLRGAELVARAFKAARADGVLFEENGAAGE